MMQFIADNEIGVSKTMETDLPGRRGVTRSAKSMAPLSAAQSKTTDSSTTSAPLIKPQFEAISDSESPEKPEQVKRGRGRPPKAKGWWFVVYRLF